MSEEIGPTEAPSPGQTYLGYRLASGERFGPCTLVRPLGRGGMGEVWLAYNEAEQRHDAIKVLHVQYAPKRAAQRFVREAQAAMELGDAEEAVRTYEVGEADGRLFIRMEYVRGASLEQLDRVEPGKALALFIDLARAVAAGHRRGVVHRDIKPSNFIRTDDGRIKLLDFGLARARHCISVTRTGESLGSPPYMSLEHWEGAREIDARADVYSLGVTCYRLLTGRLPFDLPPDAPVHSHYAKLLTDTPRPIEPLAGVPAGVAPVLLKAMARQPADRFADADELLAALATL